MVSMIYGMSRVVMCFLLSILVSTIVIRAGLSRMAEIKHKPFPTTGFWIGFFETILVFAFVLEREMTGLAIIVAAKQFLGPRTDTTEQDRIRYRLGSLMSVAIAVIFAIIARAWVSHLLWVLMA
ncbi:MAG: hypothetical protein ABIJ00_12045 [Candidatus Eisenbacteria bacterium]